jgi:photosystem II stability/assembly factor-like uncharacterized protein
MRHALRIRRLTLIGVTFFSPLIAVSGPAAAEAVRRVDLREGSAVVAVVPVSPGEAVSVTPAPAIPAERDRSGWRLQQTVSNVLKAVSFSDPLHGFAAAELGAVYRTTNGGQNWTRVMNLGFPYYWYGVQAFSAQTALVVGFQNQSGAGIARWTDDGGATWTADVVIDPGNWLLGLKFADPLHGIAYGNLGYVYVTQNGGRGTGDWTKVTTDPELGWLAGNFTFRPDLNAYATGIKFCHSTDGGYTWATSHSADQVFDGGCSFPDVTHGWTGGGQISNPVSGWVHRTTDGGANWSGRLMQPAYPIRIVQFFDASFGFAAGGNIYSSAGGIWSTTDSGATWALDINTGAEMSAIDFQPVSADSTDVWCVGFLPNFSGVIYSRRIPRPGAAAVGPVVTATAGSPRLLPNPTSGSCRLAFRMAGAGEVSITVFDLSGRVVRRVAGGFYRAGAHEAVWDGNDDSGRPSPGGSYLMRARLPDRVEAGRIVLVR